MINSLLIYILNISNIAMEELQALFIYFSEHYWLGIIFIYHVIIVRLEKVNFDNTNVLWSLNDGFGRNTTFVSKAVFTFKHTEVLKRLIRIGEPFTIILRAGF